LKETQHEVGLRFDSHSHLPFPHPPRERGGCHALEGGGCGAGGRQRGGREEGTGRGGEEGRKRVERATCGGGYPLSHFSCG
jgi:hypothetical protein